MSLDTDIAPLDIPQPKLTLGDKYFSLKKENRINRMQFFVRNLTTFFVWMVFMFVFSLLSIFLSTLLNNEIPWIFIVSMIVAPISILPLLYVSVINAIKRAHDFGHSGTWYVLGYFFGPFVLAILAAIIGFFFLTMVSSDMGAVVSIFTYILIYTLPLIIGCILLFRSGNTGTNSYGSAPTGKPLI